MTQYLTEIEHAATRTIDLVWSERTRAAELAARVQVLQREVETGYNAAHALAMNAETADDVMEATGRYWETYFGDDKELFHTHAERQALAAELATRAFSTSAQAAVLLQYAKQGISLVHRSIFGTHNRHQTHIALAQCPGGRLVGSQQLRDVVWQSRNHALHWEDGAPSQSVQVCLTGLATDFQQPVFGQFLTRNLAFEIVEILGWTTFAAFHADMLGLG